MKKYIFSGLGGFLLHGIIIYIFGAFVNNSKFNLAELYINENSGFWIALLTSIIFTVIFWVTISRKIRNDKERYKTNAVFFGGFMLAYIALLWVIGGMFNNFSGL